MNSVYRIIWSAVSQSWVVVSELTSTRGKRKSTGLTGMVSAVVFGTGVCSIPAGAADYYSTIRGNFTFTEASTVTMTGNSAYGLYPAYGTSINSAYDLSILTHGQSAGGVFVRGVVNLADADITTKGRYSAGISVSNVGALTATMNSSGDIRVSTAGDYASGIRSAQNGYINLRDVDVTTTGTESNAIYATDTSVISIAGSAVIRTTGNKSNAVYSSDSSIGAQHGNINLGAASITTTGDSASGIVTNGSDAVIGINGGSINTSGSDSHGIWLLQGAHKIFDGQKDNILPVITVSGAGSAVLASSDTDSQLTLAGSTALSMNNTAGVDTWGGIASQGGGASFSR